MRPQLPTIHPSHPSAPGRLILGLATILLNKACREWTACRYSTFEKNLVEAAERAGCFGRACRVALPRTH